MNNSDHDAHLAAHINSKLAETDWDKFVKDQVSEHMAWLMNEIASREEVFLNGDGSKMPEGGSYFMKAAAKAENAKWNIPPGWAFVSTPKEGQQTAWIQDDLVEIKKEKHMGIIRRWVRKIAIEVLENFVKNDLAQKITLAGFGSGEERLQLRAKVNFLMEKAGYWLTFQPEEYVFKKIETPRPAKKKGKK